MRRGGDAQGGSAAGGGAAVWRDSEDGERAEGADREAGCGRARDAKRGRNASRLLKEEVDEEDIAEIVSKWTGIPVSKMLEGEVQKLTQMEERLRERVVGQDEAVRGGGECDSAFACGA